MSTDRATRAELADNAAMSPWGVRFVLLLRKCTFNVTWCVQEAPQRLHARPAHIAAWVHPCRGPVDKVYYCEAIDKYVSCGRDGTYRLWNGADLRHFKTLSIGSSWITDCTYMPLSRKLVFATVDRAISFYEASRGAFEITGRLYASGKIRDEGMAGGGAIIKAMPKMKVSTCIMLIVVLVLSLPVCRQHGCASKPWPRHQRCRRAAGVW